ncbi:MAG: winged helix-turn-helix transcriptional regulator [Gemmatimonadaceae bacterium]|nr:winged helix-turn-helix transcriptional regulator [Gloeobacterales cyanobacterium ES-bin-141]
MIEVPGTDPADTACTGCAPGAAEFDEYSEQQLAALCKALGHPTRIRILKLLMVRTSCVCGELVEMLPISQSTVSEHLRVLKQVGLVQGEVDGPRVCYCIEPGALARLKELVTDL